MVSERTAVGRFSRGANGRREDGRMGGGGEGAGERERSARRKMRAQEARKSEMDSFYYGDPATRFWISIIAPCTIDGDPRD